MKVKTECVCVINETVFSIAILLNRLICGAAVIWIVCGALLNFRTAADVISGVLKFNFPAGLVIAVYLLQICAGLSYVIGYRSKISAASLIAFSAVNAFIFAGIDNNNVFLFFIMMSAAAYIPVLILGPGRYSYDFKKAEIESAEFLSR